MEKYEQMVLEGRTVLGIEFGSTRIKAVLIGDDHKILAVGSHEWENRLENHIWTYTLDDIWEGLRASYQEMAAAVRNAYGAPLTRIGAIGFSGMMHGYLAFDEAGELLVPFRTWRNTMTEEASSKLTEAFQFQIPQRWSIAHLYQAILNREEHVGRISYLTTLAGYVHWRLTGRKALGVGEASGMFPIDPDTKQFDRNRMDLFDSLVAARQYPWKLADLLPEVLLAGQEAGCLTEEGARLLDPSGTLLAGTPFCPPEGDAGTGMTATNSVAKRTGNVSAGTSVFAMVVLEEPLSTVHPEIDLVTTPDGETVAMVHCNNCTSDLNAWVGLFDEFARSVGMELDKGELFGALYQKALEGDPDCGGLLAYNYYSGEHITGFEQGCPLFVRTPDSRFSLANFMRGHLFSALSTLKIGLDILTKEEGVRIDALTGHGGLFKTPVVGQKLMAAAVNTPVTVMETAGEGGAWGIALLASYMLHRAGYSGLADFLSRTAFREQTGSTIAPDPADAEGFNRFAERYRAGLAVERAAVENLSSPYPSL